MNKWKVFAGVLLIFILGGLTGMIGSGMFFKSRLHRFIDPQGPPPPIRILHQATGRMNLTDDQRLQINALLDEMHQKIDKQIRQSAPQIKQLFDQYTLKIKEKLEPAQQVRLDRTLDRIEKRMGHMQPPPHPKPGGLPGPPRFHEKAGGFQRNGLGPIRPSFSGRMGDIPSPGDFQEELDLTPEQVEKSDAIIQETREEGDTIRQRFEKERRQRFREFESEIKLLNEKAKSKLSAVLSEDQMKKLESVVAADKRTVK